MSRKNQDNDYFDSILNGKDMKSNKKYQKKNYQYNKYNNYDYNYNNYNEYKDYKNDYYEKPYKSKNKSNKYEDEYYFNQELSEFPPKLQKYIDSIDQSKILIPEHTINLIKELIKNKLVCMVCEENIMQEDSVWSCNTCYSILHLKCMEEWINKKNPQDSKINNNKIKWTCPHCNALYEDSKYPIYNCYCGKYYNAEKYHNKYLDPNLIPHGCGLLCKERICPHIKQCPLPCHPGPHVQCNQNVKILCYCRKNTKIVPCSYESENEYSCGEICNKALICRKINHTCKAICHEGPCEKFLKNNKCYECIAESRNKLFDFLKDVEKKLNDECYEATNLTHFASCLTAYIFNGEYPCKEHYAPINTDSNLKLLLKLFEVSGNQILINLKKFIPMCQKKVENSCRCKNKKIETYCFKLNYPEDILDFLGIVKEKELEKCNRICKTMKNCEIHRCERICCELRNVKIKNYSLQDPNGYHLCFKICDKILSCNIHKCENYCHKGKCKPCAYIIREGDLICSCGKTIIHPPYICGTKPECSYPCSKKRKCGHPCILNCHEGDCPPCEYLTFRKCRCGKNIIQNVKCGDNNEVLCNAICDCILNCGVHFCKIICHDHTEEYDKKYICKLICGRSLIKCEHNCKNKCHGESDCDEYACDENVLVKCKCGTLSKNYKCGKLKKLNEDLNKENKGNFCLDCNDECVKAERLKNINEAFQGLKNISEAKMKILFPNCPIDGSEEPKKEFPVKYYIDTIEMAQDKIEKVIKFENELYRYVFNAKNKIEGSKLIDIKKEEEKKFEDNKNEEKEIKSEENKNEEKEIKSEEKKNEEKDIKTEEKKNEEEDIKTEEKKNGEEKNEEKKNEEEKNEEEKNEENKIEEEKNEEEKKEENKNDNIKEKLYHIPIDEEDYDDFNEWLTLYHNLKTKKTYKINKKEKTKQYYIQMSQSQLKSFRYQKYRLSLIALLFKNYSFLRNRKLKVYHPFNYSINIRNIKYKAPINVIENLIITYTNIKPADFYLDEPEDFEFYVHFYDEELGKKVYKIIKEKKNEFNEVYEFKYNTNREINNNDLYKYLKDEHYFNFLNDGYDKEYEENPNNKIKNDEDNDDEESDEDGFIQVKNKKKKHYK